MDQNLPCQESCLLQAKHKNCLSAQDRIDWSNIDAVVSAHKSGELKKIEADDVIKREILCSILKIAKEELIVVYFSLSNKMMEAMACPDSSFLKSKQHCIH